MAKKTITLKVFADELVSRLNKGQTVDCCKAELINLAKIVKEKLGDETIEVNWKDD